MNQNDPCWLIIDNQLGNFKDRNIAEIFVLLPDIGIEIGTKVIQTLMKKSTFVGNDPLFESNRGLLISKNTRKELKKFLNECVNFFLSHGFIKKLIKTIPNYTGIPLAKTGGKDGFVNYSSIQDYIAEFTFIVPLALDKLDYLFRIYFVFLIIMLFINFAHYLYELAYHSLLLYYLAFKKKIASKLLFLITNYVKT